MFCVSIVNGHFWLRFLYWKSLPVGNHYWGSLPYHEIIFHPPRVFKMLFLPVRDPLWSVSGQNRKRRVYWMTLISFNVRHTFFWLWGNSIWNKLGTWYFLRLRINLKWLIWPLKMPSSVWRGETLLNCCSFSKGFF